MATLRIQNERENIDMNNKRTMNMVRLIRWFVSLATLVCAFAGPASGQRFQGRSSQFDVSGTYSFVRANAANAGGGFNLNGGSASLAFNFTDRFSAIADLGSYRFSALPAGITSTMYTYMVGPRVKLSKSGRLTPFVQFLVGGARLNASATGVGAGENGLAMAIGGGLDVEFHRHFAFRVAQADYLLTRFDRVDGSPATQNNIRLSTGIVIRFGAN
jgi:hypothetical protein